MHTWTFSPDSKLIRFYSWCWAADAKNLNFCRLFWGILFSPVAILMRYPVKGLIAFALWLEHRSNGPMCPEDPTDDEAWNKYHQDRKAWEAQKKARKHHRTQKVFRAIGNFFSRYGAKILTALMIGYVLFILTTLVIAIVHNPWNALVIPAGIALGLIIVGIIRLFSNRNVVRFFSDGYHHTKEKTCPLIVIEDSNRKAVTHG